MPAPLSRLLNQFPVLRCPEPFITFPNDLTRKVFTRVRESCACAELCTILGFSALSTVWSELSIPEFPVQGVARSWRQFGHHLEYGERGAELDGGRRLLIVQDCA